MPPPLKRLFLDTEFTGLTQDTTLISMAIVADSGEEFYAEFTDYNKSQASEWIKQNVINQLFLDNSSQSDDLHKYHVLGTKIQVVQALIVWLGQFRRPNEDDKPYLQIWADVPHFDWVLFCELFGGALKIPQSIHYMPMDVATLLFAKGLDISQDRSEIVDNPTLAGIRNHNALYDAHIIRIVFQKIYNNE